MVSNNIMIVEDERIVAADLQMTLEEFGYSVVGIANSGEGAIKKADSLKPDLILMDIMLKGEMNGIQAAFRISNNHDIPVIFITAYADNSTVKHALDTNPFGYILKPFKKNELKSSIQVALERVKSTGKNVQRSTFKVQHPSEEQKQVKTVGEGEISSVSLNDITPNSFYFRKDSSVHDPSVALNQQSSISTLKSPLSRQPFAELLDKHNTTLYTLIRELEKEDNISQRSMNLLIKVSYRLAVFKVKKNINKIFNLNKRWNLSVEDIAVECISGLFVKNSKQNMLNLKYILHTWEESVNDNMDAMFFINKAVGLSVDQSINKMIRNSDPAFAKVLDTINYTIKRYDYYKTDYFGIIYIVRKSSGPVSGCTVEYDEFNNIPLDMSLSKKEMLEYLCCYLDDCTPYFPAIPLNPLIERILGYNQNSACEFECESPSHFARISMDDIVQSSLKATENKLKKTYIDTGKITSREGDILFFALKDIAFDLREGNSIWQLSDYIKVYKEDLSKDEYRERYQFVIEYLVKMFKQMIVKKIG